MTSLDDRAREEERRWLASLPARERQALTRMCFGDHPSREERMAAAIASENVDLVGALEARERERRRKTP